LEHGMCECVICCWKGLFKGYNFLVENWYVGIMSLQSYGTHNLTN